MEDKLSIKILEAIKLIAASTDQSISYSVSHHEEPTGVFGTGLRSKATIKHTNISITLSSLTL
jgi:hypothetical protein